MTTTHHPARSTAGRRGGASRFAGIAFAVVLVAGLALLWSGADVYDGATLEDYAAYHAGTDAVDRVGIAAYLLLPFAAGLLLLAVAGIRVRLDRATGGVTAASRMAGAAATVMAVGLMAAGGANLAGAIVASGTTDGGFPADPATGYALELLGSQLFLLTACGGTFLALSVAIATRRTGQLSGWMRWVGIVVAVLLPFYWLLFSAPLLAFVLWVAAVGVMLEAAPEQPA